MTGTLAALVRYGLVDLSHRPGTAMVRAAFAPERLWARGGRQ
jgi:hypothetical protein